MDYDQNGFPLQHTSHSQLLVLFRFFWPSDKNQLHHKDLRGLLWLNFSSLGRQPYQLEGPILPIRPTCCIQYAREDV